MKTIWYKNWEGRWMASELAATNRNLEWVRKHLAENGVCEIFRTAPIVGHYNP